jgi:hypothetical protein
LLGLQALELRRPDVVWNISRVESLEDPFDIPKRISFAEHGSDRGNVLAGLIHELSIRRRQRLIAAGWMV